MSLQDFSLNRLLRILFGVGVDDRDQVDAVLAEPDDIERARLRREERPGHVHARIIVAGRPSPVPGPRVARLLTFALSLHIVSHELGRCRAEEVPCSRSRNASAKSWIT